ncbi:MAG: hypothetical protein HN964_04315 [Candidatus Jacksonbacteria bacterium]|jgi:hypothetical protein|nr:hypothetical protein [Candidatus Jacksonbacteria bacterium]MBT7008647.1 hypothetical protein [Candidatus Jacksonbacteria bacterium]
MISNILWGLVVGGVGFLLSWKTEWFVYNFGRMAWAEKYLGAEGGTRLATKFIGFLAIAAGLMLITGLFDNFMNWFAGIIVPGSNR